MLNQSIYLVNPASRKIVNEGVASVNDETMEVLRYELETFVCDGQYEKGLEYILDCFLKNLNGAQQQGVWVSGFFGSGKSHLVKILCALWKDRSFPDGATARGLVNVSETIKNHLKELTIQGRRSGGLHAASGTLSAGASGSLRLALLGIILKSAGLPEQCPQARFVIWLKSEGIYDTVKNKVIENGSDWEAEIDNLYVSEDLHQALAEVKPNVFADANSCAEVLINQYPNVQDVSNDDMVKIIRQALMKDGKFPLTLVVIDEVQQYIGEDGQKSQDVQEVVETCCKNIGSKLLFIGTGQTAVSGTSNLKKLEGRFTLRIELSDADVTAVVRKVILAKKPDVINDIKQVMQKNIGEISRHLAGTSIGHRQQDGEQFSQDYPLLPVRRRFWEYMLRVLDQTGTDSQLRNQLSMVHRAAQTNLELELGHVIPADFLYFDLADKLLQARILPRKVHEKTMVWRDQGEIEQLKARACGLVFLINRLTRDNKEIGIKATVDTLADLMVSDLASGSSSLRSQLPGILEKCELLMKVNDGYCIQTDESRAWYDEFESQRNLLGNETHSWAADRDERLKKKFIEVVGKLTLTPGQSKVARDITLVFDAVLPSSTDNVQVWVRNGWNVIEGDEVRIVAKQAGLQSPVIYVYIPKLSADNLRSHIIEYKASDKTLYNKEGTPITPEGDEARAAMETRKSMAELKINELLAEALSGAKVFQAGGHEVLGLTLKDAVLEAAANSLQRLYPQFSTADHSNWGTVYNKAQQGAPDALSAVSYTNEPINHPVCKAIMGYIAAGKAGNNIRSQFEGAPYGWSRDAVDGALLVLMIAGQVRGVDEHSRTIEAKGLDRKQIAKLLFRVETVVVQTTQRLKVRKLYQVMGIQFETGKETAKGSDFLTALQALADTAGGAPPQPARPDTTVVAEIQQKSGNEQLIGLAENCDTLMEYITTWRNLADKIATLLPNWEKLQRLLRVEGASVVAADIIVQVTAVSEQRLLLEEPDSIAPLLKSLEEILRHQLHVYQQGFLDRYQKGLEALSDDGSWQKMSATQQQDILLKCNINEPMKIVTGTSEQLVAALQKYPLTSWIDRTAALSGRFHKAIELAIKELEPEIQHCDIPRRTLKNTEDIDAWLQEVGEKLKAALGKGPVIMR